MAGRRIDKGADEQMERKEADEEEKVSRLEAGDDKDD